MNQSQDDRLPRKTAFATIGLVVAVVLGATVGVTTVGAAPVQSNSEQYSVVQGDECMTIEPLGHGHQSATEFYDYRTPNTTDQNASDHSFTYSSHGTTNLQEDDTSIMFLHKSRDGLSLAFVHDQLNGNTSGGAVTMQVNNLPEDGEWVIEDDNYPGADDEFDHRGATSRISWTFTEGRSDGAVFNGGLDGDFAIEIVPFFNDNADMQQYDGEISDWQVVSGPPHDPQRTSLNMSEPITIQSGGCDSFSVTDLTVDENASVGEPAHVEATAKNDGSGPVTGTVQFTVDGEVVDRQQVELGPGETTTVESTVEFNESGTYTVGANDQTTDVTVDDDESMPGFGIVAAALGALLVALVARARL
ncbi:CARDB domain-containing protein [Halosolutus gelatinilyticus]|uniref:CARDB domain-containing protein n=1 Tax=Halosolutus gelatinilyticus TaxID=2931975 RepID=UPI001FF223B2|nr:CARDB domain-containing protein [Halosolutus gelatinilyticus]